MIDPDLSFAGNFFSSAHPRFSLNFRWLHFSGDLIVCDSHFQPSISVIFEFQIRFLIIITILFA